MDKDNKKAVKKGTDAAKDRKPRSVSKSADKKKGKADAKASKSKSKAKDKKAKSEANKENKKKSKSKSKESKKISNQTIFSELKEWNSKNIFIGKQKKGGKKGEIEEEKAEERKPQRAISAYIYFSNDQVPKIKEKEGVSHKEAMSLAGAKWKEISDKEKKVYEDMHAKDQKR